ncbi:MAG: response regulator [bacterium]|nr:response regulator [bacterium]
MADKKTVYIIDDDQFLVDMYAIKFRESGYDVKTSTRGTAALEEFEKGESPDVVLLDIVMPTLDGFQILEEIRKKKLIPDTVIVILSNLGQQEDIEKGTSFNIQGYIVKASCTPSEVVAKVGAIVKKAQK